MRSIRANLNFSEHLTWVDCSTVYMVTKKLKKEFQNDKINSNAVSRRDDYANCEVLINQIMDAKYRDFLTVYSLDKDINVAETIFTAIFKGKLSFYDTYGNEM